MGFPRQEYWSGLPFPSPGYLPDPGVEPVSPASPALAGGFFTTEPPGKPIYVYVCVCIYIYIYNFFNKRKFLDRQWSREITAEVAEWKAEPFVLDSHIWLQTQVPMERNYFLLLTRIELRCCAGLSLETKRSFINTPIFNWLPLISSLRECDGNDDLWVEWGRKEKNSLLKVRIKQMVYREIKVIICFKLSKYLYLT